MTSIDIWDFLPCTGVNEMFINLSETRFDTNTAHCLQRSPNKLVHKDRFENYTGRFRPELYIERNLMYTYMYLAIKTFTGYSLRTD